MLWPPCKIAVARRASARGAGAVRSNELLDDGPRLFLPILRGNLVWSEEGSSVRSPGKSDALLQQVRVRLDKNRMVRAISAGDTHPGQAVVLHFRVARRHPGNVGNSPGLPLPPEKHRAIRNMVAHLYVLGRSGVPDKCHWRLTIELSEPHRG